MTRKRWMLFIACGFGGFGVLVGLAGFFGWSVKLELLAKLLGP